MAAQAPVDDMHVIIIGSGITGLVLAQGLKKHGIKYSIFEKEVSLNYRSNEWTMAIHWSLDLLKTLLPEERFEYMTTKASCNPAVPYTAGGNYPIIHAETGNLLAGVPFAQGLRVPRSRMRALCAEGIDVQYGKELVDVAFNESGSGVIASFKDGTVVKGTTIIGSDGARSAVRRFARGSENSSNEVFPIIHTNMTVCYNDAEKAQAVRQRYPTSFLALSEQSFHAFQSISSMPNGPEDPASWIFHLAAAWRGTNDKTLTHAQRLEMIKEKAKNVGEPTRSAFMWIPEGTQVHQADISYWITQPWNNHEGRITMCGDAAHPMPPYRGQGLNHAIKDVSQLVHGLLEFRAGRKTLKDAIDAFDAEIVPRGAEEVKCSVENGIMLHDWELVKKSPVFNQGFKPMTGHDKTEVSEHAAVQQQRDEENKTAVTAN